MNEEQLRERFDRIESLLQELLSKLHSTNKDVMSTNEIAQYLGVTAGHIRKMVSDGNIPCYKQGRRNYFKRTEIDEWRATVRRKTNKELAIEAATMAAISRK